MQIKCTLYSVLNSCIVYRYTLNSLLLLYFIQLHMHKENMSNKYMHACHRKMPKYTFPCMFMYKSSVLTSWIVYIVSYSWGKCVSNICMHANRKSPKCTTFPCMHVLMRVQALVCPSNTPAMFVSGPHVILSLHVQTWLRAGAMVTLPIPGTRKGSWARVGLRHPTPSPGAAIRRPRSHCTSSPVSQCPNRAGWHWQHYAAHDRASPCRKILLTIPPHELSLKRIAVARLTPWPTD